eukprot:GHVU01018297.1.p1 GENE.GHVU01018297.1~~GHVU01018297.1.p1  ORF type:complete len:119 (-),score=2.63 GHVU01018297.1:5-361(-)
MVRQALTCKPSNLVDGRTRGTVLLHGILAHTPATLPFSLALHIVLYARNPWKLQVGDKQYKAFKEIEPEYIDNAVQYHDKNPGETRGYDVGLIASHLLRYSDRYIPYFIWCRELLTSP